MIESFVIHFRGLLDFLYAERPKPNDVIAADYFLPGEWEGLKPPLSDTLKRAKSRAHKEVAHLTYERLNVTPETKPWAFVSLSNEIQSVMNVFLVNVTKNRLGAVWQGPQATGSEL